MKIRRLNRFVLWLFILCFPCLLTGQDQDKRFDSLRILAGKPASAQEQTEHILQLLWYIYRYKNDTYKPFTDQLDSLYHCCVKGSASEPYDHHLEAQITFFKGNDWIYLTPDTARTYLLKSIRYARASGDSSLLALSQLALCETLSVLGDSVAFAAQYEEVIRNSRHIVHLIDKVSFHNNIGVVCASFGRYGDAVAHYFEAIEIIENDGDEQMLK